MEAVDSDLAAGRSTLIPGGPPDLERTALDDEADAIDELLDELAHAVACGEVELSSADLAPGDL